MSRSAVLAAVFAKEIAKRKAYLDAAPDLATITITVKLNAGTTWVRGVSYHEETVVLAREQPKADGR